MEFDFKDLRFIHIESCLNPHADGPDPRLYSEWISGNQELSGSICFQCSHILRGDNTVNSVIVFDAKERSHAYRNLLGVVCTRECDSPYTKVKQPNLAKIIPIFAFPEYQIKCPFDSFKQGDF